MSRTGNDPLPGQAFARIASLSLLFLIHTIAIQRAYPTLEERAALLPRMREAPGTRLLFAIRLLSDETGAE